jgi:hypothetical protein
LGGALNLRAQFPGGREAPRWQLAIDDKDDLVFATALVMAATNAMRSNPRLTSENLIKRAWSDLTKWLEIAGQKLEGHDRAAWSRTNAITGTSEVKPEGTASLTSD